MKYICLFTFLIFIGCESIESKKKKEIDEPSTDFTLEIAEEDAIIFEKLRLYPILANAAMIKKNQALKNLKTLEEALSLKGFHITEKKKFGPDNETGVIDQLTVQNKSRDTVFLMIGDIVKGGKQDRVIAQNMILPPRKLSQISVFCVEKNRWYFKNIEGDTSVNVSSKKQYAFTGHYHLASNDLRKIIIKEKNQEAIWNKVSQITSFHEADSETNAYANLEASDSYTTERDRYLQFFRPALSTENNIVGVLSLSGGKILGADIFAHPNIFEKKKESLLRAYVTEAVSLDSISVFDADKLDRYVKQLNWSYNNKRKSQKDQFKKFRYQEKIVHFTSL